MHPDWLRLAFEVCMIAQFWTKLLKSWTQHAICVKFWTHIPIRLRKKCCFLSFKSASWWRYKRLLHVFLDNSTYLSQTLYAHSVQALGKNFAKYFSHLPCTAPPGGRLMPRTLFAVTPTDFFHNSGNLVDSISTVMWSTWNSLIAHIASWLAKIAFWSLWDCSLLNKLA